MAAVTESQARTAAVVQSRAIAVTVLQCFTRHLESDGYKVAIGALETFMDAGIATMFTAFVGFSAAGLISWRRAMRRLDARKSTAPEQSKEQEVAVEA